ncbi:hypothetical protein HII31_00693 [Pseudocercospora fuligena]|uniref:Uncharacterized protein n=1 Tax=Pseudocercospora fuligena TaxID=685502 RepID=A0A8H6RV16_9PEZI|nr:hypothetical protein HII31_00693 [Pseudocercospora fuligena]
MAEALFYSACFEPSINTMCDPTFSKKNIKKWFAKMTSPPRKNRFERGANDASTGPENASDANSERTATSEGDAKSSIVNGEPLKTENASEISFVSTNDHSRRAASWPSSQPRQVDLAAASNVDSLQQSSEGVRLGHGEPENTSTRDDDFDREGFQRRFTQALRRRISIKTAANLETENDVALLDTPKQGKMGPPSLPHRAKVRLMFRFEKTSAYSDHKADELHHIAFNASPEVLVAILKEACNRVCREKYADLLRYLLSIGSDLDMNAYIAFGDGRDEFIHKDQLGRFRWRCIADLFPTSIDPSKDFEIPIKIKVSVINKEVPLPPPASIDIWKQHRSADALLLRSLITEGLRDLVAKKPKGYDWRPDSLVSIARLFDSEAERHWWIDIWVMPQSKRLGAYRRLAKKGGAGKNLAAFLDPATTEEGNRKLWVEAHLLEPKKEDGF